MSATMNFSKYPAYFELNGDNTYTIRLRNWVGAFSFATNLEESKGNAKILLLNVLNSLISNSELIPYTDKAQKNDYIIELPIDTSLKIVLINEMLNSRYKKADLARGLNIPPQRLTSFLSLKKATNLQFISEAFAFMGKSLSFSI